MLKFRNLLEILKMYKRKIDIILKVIVAFHVFIFYFLKNIQVILKLSNMSRSIRHKIENLRTY